MALPLPPSSHLHSILLVTKSRSLGPRLVFHYPPLSPSAADLSTKKAPTWFAAETSTGSVVDSNSSSSDWDSSTENDGGDDDIEIGSRTSGGRGSGKTVNSTGQSHRGEKDGKLRPGAGGAWGREQSIDEEDADNGEGRERGKVGSGTQKGGDRDWDNVLGFKVDALEKMLCPERAFNKRRFELGVESVVFVGAPMFVRDDGLWKKMKKRRKRSAEETNMTAEESDDEEDGHRPRPPLKKNESFIFPPGFEPGYGHGMVSGAPSIATSEAGSDTRSNSTTNDTPDMTMFNVVFVLNPPALEYQLRVKDIYDNVTKKYAKALKYEQARFQYVWSESKRIIDIKQRAKERKESLIVTWQKIMSTSPLAKSIATLFEAVSHDRIAHIHFDASFNSSFQIPQADSTPYLPNALEPQMPGLWLTTSNVVADDDDGAPMTQHAALLLLEDPDIIIKDLQNSGDKSNAAILAFYIRNIVPTKSLLKISTKQRISAEDMEYIATHLVYWRRARLIAPLHPRDTYIVSPNADLSQLQPATAAYAARFPTLPSLQKMFSLLSGTPKPYRFFIPTSEHTDAYMEILAWLMRGGWVTQLRTFAWVRVAASDTGSVSSARTTIPYTAGRPTSPAQLSHTLSRDANLPHRPSPLHLKTVSPSRRQPFSPTSPSISTSANMLPPPSPPLSPEPFSPSLILNPQKASTVETLWLEKIGQSFEDEELRGHWPMLLRYFDGARAINDISPREGLKRNKVAQLVGGVREKGILVIVRHW
ncbi:hypothetical protein P280DRAFT_453834 [Massarina eburnea CBS 473.64]|uniref:Nitrogen permease regulator 3 n=1 Tax=Massarina eburnea CBS 473.64 TaxID=1395130 RepID=A0A6A6RZ97_9PLEO|nr:hypothetical protein P280DRAFT_453834 [Massarina eburnea CBS 473.64]